MAAKRLPQSNNNNYPIDPSSLPDDGSSVTFEQTFRKKVGDGTSAVGMTADDFETADWQVERQTDSGWATIDVVAGRPHKPELREMYGEGKYRIMPLDPRDRRPMESLHRIELIGSPVLGRQAATPVQAPMNDDLPPWMRLMMAQQAQERADAIRRAEEAEARRAEWEKQQAQREWERQEREERERRAREDRESEDRRMASDRQNQMMIAGLAVAKELFANKRESSGDSDTSAMLLQALLHNQEQRQAVTAAPSGSLKETLELLVVLDKIAEGRAERNAPPPPPEPEEENLGKSFMGMLPMLMAMRGGGAQNAAPPAFDPAMIQQLTGQAVQKMLADPDAIAEYAGHNPDVTAKAFLAAVKKNPSLESAVMKVLEEDEGE
jgi:hypothetical protein